MPKPLSNHSETGKNKMETEIPDASNLSPEKALFLHNLLSGLSFITRLAILLAIIAVKDPVMAKEQAEQPLQPENSNSKVILPEKEKPSSHSLQLGPRRLRLPEYLPEDLPEKENPLSGITTRPGADGSRIMISSLLRESVTETVHGIPGGIEIRVRTDIEYGKRPNKIILRITVSGNSETKPQNVSVAPVIKGIRGEEKTGRLKRGSDTVTFDLPVSRDSIDINHRIQNIPLELDVSTDDDWKISKTTTRLLVGYAEYTGWAIASDNVKSQWAFVLPNDKNIIRISEKARSIVESEEEGPVRNLKAINAIFSAFRENGLKRGYDKQYETLDFHPYIQFPSETLYFGGDCEDLSIAYASALLAAGIDVCLVDHEDHVFVIADAGATVAEAAKEIGEVPLEWFFAVKDGKLISGDKDPEGHAWIPLETLEAGRGRNTFELWNSGVFTALKTIHWHMDYQVLPSPKTKLEIKWPIQQGQPYSLMSEIAIASPSASVPSDTHDDLEILEVERLPDPSTPTQRRQAYLNIIKLLDPHIDVNQLMAFYDETLKTKSGLYFFPKWKP